MLYSSKIFFSLFFALCLAQLNAEGEEKKLQSIQKDIQKVQKQTTNLEKNAKSIETRLVKQKKTLQSQKKKLTDLQKIKNTSKKEKKLIETQLASINKRLSELEAVYIKLFTYLFEFEYLKKENPRFKEFLLLFIASTQDYIDATVQQNKKLGQSEKIVLKKINTIDKKYKYEKNKIDAQSKIISTTQSSLKKSEDEKKRLLNALAEYKKQEEKLRELIADINRSTTPIPYSYKFSTDRLIWPVDGNISNYFKTIEQSKKGELPNDGIDIKPQKQEIVAVERGVVVYSSPYLNGRKLIIIDHNNGFITTYNYKGDTFVSINDKVEKKQVIARLKELSSLLHFEVRRGTDPIDPMTVLITK